MNIKKYITFLFILILLVYQTSIVCFAVEDVITPEQKEAMERKKKEAELKNFQDDLSKFSKGSSTLNVAIIFVYIIVFLTIGLLLFFSIMNIAGNFKESYKGLLGLVALIVIFLIGYAISSPELTESAIKMQVTGQQLKWMGGGMFTFYVVFFGAILAIVGSIIMNAVKKAK